MFQKTHVKLRIFSNESLQGYNSLAFEGTFSATTELD